MRSLLAGIVAASAVASAMAATMGVVTVDQYTIDKVRSGAVGSAASCAVHQHSAKKERVCRSLLPPRRGDMRFCRGWGALGDASR